MRKVKVFCFLLIIFFCNISLVAIVNFEFQFDIDYPENNPTLNNIQIIDVNGDEQLDIVLFYETQENNLLIECYNINGEFITEKIVTGNFSSNSKGWLTHHNDDLLIIGEFIYEYELMIKIQNFNSNDVVDSLIINEAHHYALFPIEITDLKAYSHNDDLIILAGVLNNTGIYINETDLYRFTFNDSLHYDQVIQDSGEEIHDFTGSDYLVTTGYIWEMDFELYYSDITRYINYISKNDYSTLIYLYESSGSNTSSISHWPAQFIVLNQNDNYYYNYGLLLQKVVYDSDGNSVHFRNYFPNETNLNWSSDSTLIGHNLITSSTCIKVNNENHYVMYFRNNFLEIRDRITGEIIHHQESDIIPSNIEMDSSNDLFFFVDNEEDEILSVYKLAEEIYVSSDENQIPINDFNLINYPNPFNPSGAGRGPTTTIAFNLTTEHTSLRQGYAGQAESTELIIYNIKGQKIKTLAVTLSGVEGSVVWDGTDEDNQPVSSGIYFYKLNVNGKIEAVKKCLLLK